MRVCGFLSEDGQKSANPQVYTILYHRCPDCRQAHLPTADGLVEIPPDVVDRVEGDAVRVAIDPEEERPAGAANAHANPEIKETVPAEERDRTNPTTLVRKVRLRDGCACANPMCRKKECWLHAHHIIWRVNGGRTAIWNEVLVCSICHANYAQSDGMLSPFPNSLAFQLLPCSHCA